ncbi:MAG: hypothetical protein AVDCRST_MAG49-52, partial [uncultured Thermomicrobiales bacterium]
DRREPRPAGPQPARAGCVPGPGACPGRGRPPPRAHASAEL